MGFGPIATLERKGQVNRLAPFLSYIDRSNSLSTLQAGESR